MSNATVQIIRYELGINHDLYDLGIFIQNSRQRSMAYGTNSLPVYTCFYVIDWTPRSLEFFRLRNVPLANHLNDLKQYTVEH